MYQYSGSGSQARICFIYVTMDKYKKLLNTPIYTITVIAEGNRGGKDDN